MSTTDPTNPDPPDDQPPAENPTPTAPQAETPVTPPPSTAPSTIAPEEEGPARPLPSTPVVEGPKTKLEDSEARALERSAERIQREGAALDNVTPPRVTEEAAVSPITPEPPKDTKEADNKKEAEKKATDEAILRQQAASTLKPTQLKPEASPEEPKKKPQKKKIADKEKNKPINDKAGLWAKLFEAIFDMLKVATGALTTTVIGPAYAAIKAGVKASYAGITMGVAGAALSVMNRNFPDKGPFDKLQRAYDNSKAYLKDIPKDFKADIGKFAKAGATAMKEGVDVFGLKEETAEQLAKRLKAEKIQADYLAGKTPETKPEAVKPGDPKPEAVAPVAQAPEVPKPTATGTAPVVTAATPAAPTPVTAAPAAVTPAAPTPTTATVTPAQPTPTASTAALAERMNASAIALKQNERTPSDIPSATTTDKSLFLSSKDSHTPNLPPKPSLPEPVVKTPDLQAEQRAGSESAPAAPSPNRPR